MKNIRFIVFTALVMVCGPVFSYIDPGSGSAIMSAIIGFFVALGLVVKTYWYKLKALFAGLTGLGSGTNPESEQSEDN